MIEPTIGQDEMLSWESQEKQFQKVGRPGITYHQYCCCNRVNCRKGIESCGEHPVDTFLYRNNKGHVVGILYCYRSVTAFEVPGNINIWVRPDRQRRGIGTALVRAFTEKFGDINLDQQRYSPAGAEFAERLIRGTRTKAENQ